MQVELFKTQAIVEKKKGDNARNNLYNYFRDKITINYDLNRSLVSYQANKNEPFYRWYKFKEGYSSKFVNYVLRHFLANRFGALHVLDPFAGSGTTVTTSVANNHWATGIELLPIGIAAIKARLISLDVNIESFGKHYSKVKLLDFQNEKHLTYHFPHLSITKNAFPQATEIAISNYMSFINTIEDEKVRYLYWFACLSILEDISFTSKDGQYLRWDYRSKRSKSTYSKNRILNFRDAILSKLRIIFDDIKNNRRSYSQYSKIIEGSCLERLPELTENLFDLVITSPPYCNRYDYTRIYALELAFMHYDEDMVKVLRQKLLSSTVENKSKKFLLEQEYLKRGKQSYYNFICESFEKQAALHEILDILYIAKDKGELNNNSLPRMIENYFFEMNIVIHELGRVLRPGGRIYMVNDNVQYFGEEVPVDLILSSFAEHAGLKVDHIWVLPKGKGNSSQQMGSFGRKEIRKCVYVWSKPNS